MDGTPKEHGHSQEAARGRRARDVWMRAPRGAGSPGRGGVGVAEAVAAPVLGSQ